MSIIPSERDQDHARDRNAESANPTPASPAPASPAPVSGSGEPLQAVIFDVDGTLADTERDGHRIAFNDTFRAAGLPYEWGVEEYGQLLTMAGGRRRLRHYLRARGHPDEEAAALATALHQDKTRRFTDVIRAGGIQPRPGTAELIRQLRQHEVRIGIATTGTSDWVLPLLETLFGLEIFDVLVTGSDITDLKPSPVAYLEALARLNVPARNVVAIEDSANGVRAAVAAGLCCVAVVNDYTRDQDLSGAVAVLDDVARPEGVSVLWGDPELRHGLTVEALRRLVTAPTTAS